MRYSKRGAFRMELNCIFCPAIAVPITVKIPEPITAPMPSEVKLTAPSDFFSRFSGSCESEISLSMSLVRKICAPNRHLPVQRKKLYNAPRLRATVAVRRKRLILTAVGARTATRIFSIFRNSAGGRCMLARGADVKQVEDLHIARQTFS